MKISELEKHVFEFDEWKNTYGPYEIVESLDGTESHNCVWTNISRFSANYLVNEVRELGEKYDQDFYIVSYKPYAIGQEITLITAFGLECESCSIAAVAECGFCLGLREIWVDLFDEEGLKDIIESIQKQIAGIFVQI